MVKQNSTEHQKHQEEQKDALDVMDSIYAEIAYLKVIVNLLHIARDADGVWEKISLVNVIGDMHDRLERVADLFRQLFILWRENENQQMSSDWLGGKFATGRDNSRLVVVYCGGNAGI